MLSDFLPTCPRWHPGMMVSDDSYIGREWVCRACGTRLYGNDQGGAELPKESSEKPINDNLGNLTGRPRYRASRIFDMSKMPHRLGGLVGGGKWYE